MAQTIIGLAGAAGVGKTTVARAITSQQEGRVLSFAHPLRQMLFRYLAMCDVGFDRIKAISTELKEQPVPELQGRSYRHAMQTLGTDWGRQHLGSQVWVAPAMAQVDTTDALVVFDDVRFPSEVIAIRERGGVVIKLERPGAALPAKMGHVSEDFDFVVDAVVQNSGTREDSAKAVLDYVSRCE